MRRFARILPPGTSPRTGVLRVRRGLSTLLLLTLLVGACRSRLPVDHVARPTGDLPSVPSAPEVPAPAPTPEPAPAPPGTSIGPALHVEYYQISDG